MRIRVFKPKKNLITDYLAKKNCVPDDGCTLFSQYKSCDRQCCNLFNQNKLNQMFIIILIKDLNCQAKIYAGPKYIRYIIIVMY